MYLPLIFFFLSLFGIIIMLWRELVLVRSGQVTTTTEHLHPFVPDLQKIKYLILKLIKKSGYILIFVTIRSYLLSSKFIKEKSKIILKEIKNKIKKNSGDSLNEITEKKEVSKYLKVISEYRQKIKKMKKMIKEEEGIK
jgi:hypothetical protein